MRAGRRAVFMQVSGGRCARGMTLRPTRPGGAIARRCGWAPVDRRARGADRRLQQVGIFAGQGAELTDIPAGMSSQVGGVQCAGAGGVHQQAGQEQRERGTQGLRR
ncbi:MAG: hypothetical protein ACU85V_18350 [Gammaproteobacteria bacterium]